MAAGQGNLLRALQIPDYPPAAVRIDESATWIGDADHSFPAATVRIDESAARIGDADHSFPAAAVRIDDPLALFGSGMAAGRGNLL
jgi:hypothetical protein